METDLLLGSVNADALVSWPVTWGLPLRPGQLQDLLPLVIETADGEQLPAQSRALTRHPDGSVRRLLVTAEPAIPGPGQQTLKLRPGSASIPDPAQAGTADICGAVGAAGETAEGLRLNAVLGPIDFIFSAAGAPAGEAAVPLDWQADGVEIFARGPVAAAAVFRGWLCRGGERLAQTRLTLRVSARTPVLLADALVLNLSTHEYLTFDYLRLRLQRRNGAWTEVNYEVRQQPYPRSAELPLEVRAEKLKLTTIRGADTSAHTHRLLNYNETWFSLNDGPSRTVLSLRNFFEYFPYAVQLSATALQLDLWPDWSPQPWRLRRGAGKTHELALALLPAEPAWQPRAVGHAVGKPPLPRLALPTQQQAGVFTELLDYAPDDYPRFETMLFDLAANRNRGYGKMHWGDDFSPLYTNQLRGAGAIVWNNLEGDHPFHAWCQFQRTGRYSWFKDYHDSILHWADVDFCDDAEDPLDSGALRIHSADHWCAGSCPSHNWAEGFREWYFATGDPRPLEILGKMTDWIMRRAAHGDFKVSPEPYVRACGWGLIQMAALQEVIEREELREIIGTLCRELLAYCRQHDGLVMTIPTGGTWQPMDNAFHTATVVIGAYRCWRLYGDDLMRELALAASEPFLDERTATAEGIPVYISGPEQRFPMQQAATFAMGALACAYYLTREIHYVARGMRMLEYCLDRGMILDHMRIPGEFLEIGDDIILNVTPTMPNSQLLSYQLRGMLLFMRAAHETGMLKQVDYRY